MKKPYYKYRCPKCDGQMIATTKDYEKAKKCPKCRIVIKVKDFKIN
jgi:DNA-directed RNA polymerase subunit M/transcription elongation factor TFIIS